MGDGIACGKFRLGTEPTSSLFSSDKGQSSAGEGIYDICGSSGGSDLRQIRGVQRKLSLHLLFFQWLQHKIISIPKHHVLGWHVLNSFAIKSIKCLLSTSMSQEYWGEGGVFCFYFIFFLVFSFVFLGPHLRPMEVPRLGVESELQPHLLLLTSGLFLRLSLCPIAHQVGSSGR